MGVANSKYPAGLVRFWSSVLPKGRARSSLRECLIVWESDNLEEMAVQVIAALEAWNRSDDWTKEGGEFVLGAHRWLKRAKYESPPEQAPHDPNDLTYEWTPTSPDELEKLRLETAKSEQEHKQFLDSNAK